MKPGYEQEKLRLIHLKMLNLPQKTKVTLLAVKRTATNQIIARKKIAPSVAAH